MTGGSTRSISVLLVDDHALFREALSARLAATPGVRVVAEHGTLAEAIGTLQAQSVDLILLDYELRGERGSALLAWLKEHRHPARVLVVAAALDPDQVLDLTRAGAAGLVLKDKPVTMLLEAVRTVASGGMWLDQELAAPVMAAAARAPDEVALTERERVVLRHVLEGLSNKEIGGCLGTSETAVKATLQRLFEKTGVRTRGQLIRIALSEHLDLLR